MSSRLRLRSARLLLRPLGPDDAWFILRLFNEPSFRENIGDRGVETPEQARLYIERGPAASYAAHGDGLLAVEELESEGVAVGICGLVRREGLEGPDLGFAFLPEAWGHGYATEASDAVLDSCRQEGIGRVLAITSPHNVASQRVLAKCGFESRGSLRLPGETTDVLLYAVDLEGETSSDESVG